jgi:hypothetical protein
VHPKARLPAGVSLKMKKSYFLSKIFGFLRHILPIAVGAFFFCFGIQVLISAYQLKDPISFVMVFFASNFIILISAALLVGFIYRANRICKKSKKRA